MPCGWGDVKSMVQIELKTLKEKNSSALFCFPHQSNLRPQSNSLPWGHIKPGFSTSQKTSSAKQYWISQTATTSIYPPLSSLPLWAGGLVTFFFPRTLLSSSCSPDRGHLSQEAWGNIQFLLLAPALRFTHLYRNGCVTEPRTLGEEGAVTSSVLPVPSSPTSIAELPQSWRVSFPFPCTPLTTF